MWVYVKHLERQVEVSRPDLQMAKYVFTQYGGPDGEFSAGWRYLTQMFAMPTGFAKAVLNDIGTEELAHLEIVGTIIHLLIQDASPEEMEKAGLGDHFAQHGHNLWFHDAAGVPWTATYLQSFDDPVTVLHENMAAEQKARSTYENLICLSNDKKLNETLSFLRQREVVHFQRFGETLDRVHELYNHRHVFYGP
ncbi:MAG: manganese catalase family protein [Clostridia bacterium]|nr:MAG: manganese catalase family protein [Clostridia bacterium]